MSCVVIVDDQAVNRKVLSRLAATLETDVDVQVFSDPLDVLSFASSRVPDLLVTDFLMPNLNGAELIRRLRAIADCRDVPAIVVTAYEDVQFRTLALEAGANEFLLSPIDHEKFLTQSRELLSMRRAAKTNSVLTTDMTSTKKAKGGIGQFEMFNSLVENIAGRLLHRTDELQRIGSEMQSLLEGSRTAAIFVDENLLIRRCTPEGAAIYNISPSDVGRPLTSFQCQLIYDTLEQDFEKVVRTCLGIDRYLEHRTTQTHYLLRIIPNQFQQRAKLGATLIFSKLSVWSGENDRKAAH
jgi:CheY-like chemotaxis protein